MRRDRHGRGMRGPLAPSGLPMRRTPVEEFNALVLQAVNAIERHMTETMGRHSPLGHVEFAVEDVPPQMRAYEADIVESHGVALSKLYPAQPGTAAAAPRIVLYRRPIELRSDSDAELGMLVSSVLVEQLASLLNLPPESLEP
ncbi:metallopeptidase family protein [Glycomyces arizonensis]|uniref:metallopeptidase family protein n=1 Tax=Glycomyces arizonensis TaxID=256035 RepID=UPI0012EC1BF2|nr:metallopeptidase family protein [Glycomyces arizonensis]